MKDSKNEKKTNEEIIDVIVLQKINQFAEDLLSQNTINEIVWKVTNNVVSLFQLEDCVLYLLHEEYLIKKAASNNGNTNNEELLKFVKRLKLGEGIVGQVALNKKPILIHDTSLTDDFIVDGQKGLSKIAVPLIHRGQLIGVIDSKHSERNFFDDSYLKIFEKLAALTTAKIVQARHIEKLLIRQLHMDLIYNNSNDLIFLLGVEPNSVFRCLSVNQSYLNMIGHTWEELIGNTMDEVWGEEKTKFFRLKYKQAIASKKPMTYEVIYDHISPPLVAETTITPIFDSHGICINLSGISRDITKNKEAELLLKESKGQFESLFELSPYAIFIHDFNKITHVNKAFLNLFGYKEKKYVLGKDVLKTVVDPSDHDSINKNRKKIKTGKPFFIPATKFLKSDGSTFIGESQVSTVMFYGKPHVKISSRDITKSKEAEETLLESEKRYRTLFENSLDGIYKSTREGKFVAVNPALVKMLGYDSKEELMGIDIKTELYFDLNDRAEESFYGENYLAVKKKNGEEIWVEDHGNNEYDSKGEVVFNHGIVRNVSGQIEKQKELERFLTITEDQNARLQNFAHIVSHNIRSHSSNMTSLVRFMELSQDEYEKSKLFGMLKTSTEKLEDTIQNLSEIITVNQGINKARVERNLYDEINNVLKVLSGDIREKKIAVVIDMPYDIKINIIPAYLDSILLNILSNAIKYGSTERRSKVLINAKKQQDFIILNITDNGIGIDLKKNAHKIFGMYETFHDNKDARGFGLYITKNQIEAMNGKIDITSEVGKGTTFRIYFNEEN